MSGNELDYLPSKNITRYITSILSGSWVELFIEIWKLCRKILGGLAGEGMYEVLEYESTLEIQDKEGKRAFFQKRKKVRFLQNNIIAYQDYGWGDGEQFHNYRASPGIPVDFYKVGYKTYILLSLRGLRNRGDVEEFHIQWKINNGFLKKDGFWETDISSRTWKAKMSVIFPKGRPPQNVRLVENNIRRTTFLGSDSIQKTANGRWQVTWEQYKPRLYEHYIIRWDW